MVEYDMSCHLFYIQYLFNYSPIRILTKIHRLSEWNEKTSFDFNVWFSGHVFLLHPVILVIFRFPTYGNIFLVFLISTSYILPLKQNYHLSYMWISNHCITPSSSCCSCKLIPDILWRSTCVGLESVWDSCYLRINQKFHFYKKFVFD